MTQALADTAAYIGRKATVCRLIDLRLVPRFFFEDPLPNVPIDYIDYM